MTIINDDDPPILDTSGTEHRWRSFGKRPECSRRQYQFRLRTLVVFVLLVSLPLSWLGVRMQRASKNRQTAAEVRKVAAKIESVGATVRIEQNRRSWLENLLDDPGLESIAVVDFNSPVGSGGSINPQFLPRRDVTDTDLGQMVRASLEKLTELRTLSLSNTQVTDVGLEHLKMLTNLEELYLANTQITDAGLVHLKDLTNLGLLDLYGTRVSNAGLAHLEGLTSLGTLSLGNTKVTDQGVNKLKPLLNRQDRSILRLPLPLTE